MKKSILTTSTAVCLLLFTAILFNGCSPKIDLVGKWTAEEGQITFSDDDTYSISQKVTTREEDGTLISTDYKVGETGTYSIEDNQIKFIADWTNGHDIGTHSMEFEIEDTKLILIYESENVTFIKE